MIRVLADTFAGLTLMAIMGPRRAFASRGCIPETATAAQPVIFRGRYATLLTHLSVRVKMISQALAATSQTALCSEPGAPGMLMKISIECEMVHAGAAELTTIWMLN